jgi:hypothetical protein
VCGDQYIRLHVRWAIVNWPEHLLYGIDVLAQHSPVQDNLENAQFQFDPI